MLTQKVEVVLLVLWQMVTLAASLLLSDCERSIYYCCDPTTKSPLPKRYQSHEENYLTWHSNVVCCRCFEVNNCPGLYWAGNAICSQAFLDKIERKVEEEEKQEILLSTRTIFNEVETALEDELEPVYKVPRRFKSFTQELSRKSTPLGFSKKCLMAIASCCKPGSTILPMR